jgi:cellulose synthase/poly-beta-1,6-N-acetylglucosamine synthase-like glycosyltransferase
MEGLKVLWGWLNAEAGWLFLGGLVVVALWNWWKWRQDRALALRLRDRKTEPVQLQATPKVSVLVAAWNEADIIREHIESFLRLRYPNKELVLCAGGEDGTCKIAREYSGEAVIVLEQHSGEGKQRALHRCLERATGEVLFLTDADCILNDEAFELTLAPVVNEGESVATGASRPLSGQERHPLVLHCWFADVYGRARWGRYTDGILGRNAALRRDVLETVSGFEAEVRTGTDYYLAKRVLRYGYPIRYVPDSAVETAYPETLREYKRQQTRWLRNVVMHGLRFGAYGEAVRCVIPSVIGVLMLTGPLLGLGLGRLAIVGWLLAWAHVMLSRLRYMRFGKLLTGCSLRARGYLWLPAYAIADFAIWALTLAQYPFKGWRTRW